MIKLTAKDYKGTVQRSRRTWPKYATQLMNIAGQNAKATAPKYIGSVKQAWMDMRAQGIKGTLSNWTDYYNRTYGQDCLIVAGRKIHQMLGKMGINWITEDMCIDYTMEVAYNKTHMGMGGEEMAIEVAAHHFGQTYRFSTPQEESQGIDGWIGTTPVQVKPHDSTFKGHVHNHADHSKCLVITYELKKQVCYVHNPDFIK